MMMMIIFYLFSLLLLLLLLVLFSVQVQASDTLNSVAARFDITPSELRKLNRLASSLIFPGQLIHVPDKKNPGEGNLISLPFLLLLPPIFFFFFANAYEMTYVGFE